MFGVWEAAIAAYVAGIQAQANSYMAEMNKNADVIDIEATEVKPRLEMQNTTSTGCNGQ